MLQLRVDSRSPPSEHLVHWPGGMRESSGSVWVQVPEVKESKMRLIKLAGALKPGLGDWGSSGRGGGILLEQ